MVAGKAWTHSLPLRPRSFWSAARTDTRGGSHFVFTSCSSPVSISKMFCSSCGENCPLEAKYCHKCGDRLQHNATEGAAIVDEGSKKDESDGSASATGSGSKASGLLTFAQFRARKEEDRSKHFKSKPVKKMKLHHKGNVDCQVKINIGVMIMKDGRLSIKRGYSLPLNVTPNITSEDLLEKAVEKHSRFHKDVVHSNKKAFYQLLYADKNKVSTLPGSDEPFTLKRYKEEIDKPYSRITFYLCSSSDYFDSVMGASDLDSDSDEPSEETLGLTTFPGANNTNSIIQDQAQTSSPNQKQDEKGKAQSVEQEESDLFEKDLECSVFQTDAAVQNEEVEQKRLMSCPICHSLHPVDQIEEHADSCSMWLLDDTSEEFDIPDPLPASSFNTEPAKAEELTSEHLKEVLKEQIATLSAQLLSTDKKRLTIRRKFMWQDFKSAMFTRIQPKSTLKVVFSGEPAIDDGGPKRELFSGKLLHFAWAPSTHCFKSQTPF